MRHYDVFDSVDVVIIGGGIVGLTLASLLAQQRSLRLALIEASPPPTILAEPSPLVSALNHASEALLQQTGVWSSLLPEASSYRRMQVWQAIGAGELTISSAALHLPYLGHILNNQMLHQALWQQVQQHANIQLLASKRLQAIYRDETHARVTLENGRVITAKLLIAADGKHSWIRRQLSIPLTFYDYGQQALVATIKTQLPHQQTAYQLFHEDSIVALLPLVDPYHCSLIWTLPTWRAHQLQTVPSESFSQQLAAACDRRLGDCQLVSTRPIFPLRAQYARQFAGQRVLLLGDAAHTIHPLAGQGLNLGLADVALLMEEWQQIQRAGFDIGVYAHWRRFERQRKYEAAKLLAVTHGVQRLFTGNQPLTRWLRGFGLQTIDRCTWLKNFLVHQANDRRSLNHG